MKKVLIGLAIGALLSMPGIGHATTRGVEVRDNIFLPATVEGHAGDVIHWVWSCGYNGCSGSHNVTAWQGATFASPPGATDFQVTLGADAVIRYRCTVHSTLSGGTCSGMCGVIRPDADTVAPDVSIATPKDNDVILAVAAPVRVTGSASDNVALASLSVRVYDLLGAPTDFAVPCPTCPTGSATWQADLPLGPGTYLLEAAAVDTTGNQRRTPRIRIFVV